MSEDIFLEFRCKMKSQKECEEKRRKKEKKRRKGEKEGAVLIFILKKFFFPFIALHLSHWCIPYTVEEKKKKARLGAERVCVQCFHPHRKFSGWMLISQ